MAKKGATIAADIDALIEPSQDELDLQSFIEDVGPSMSSVDVFRMHKDGRKVYKARVLFSDLKENAFEFIRDNYGPGKWILCFRDAGGRIKSNRPIEIEQEGEEEKPTTAVPVTDSTGFLREQMMMQQNLITALITNIGRPQAGPDIGALMTGIAAMMAAMKDNKNPIEIDKLLIALRPQDPSAMLASVVSAFATLKGPAKDEDWIERTGRIVELARNLSPEKTSDAGSSADSVWGVVSEVGKHVADRFLPNPSAMGRPAIAAQAVRSEVQVLPPASVPLQADHTEADVAQPDAGRERMIQWIRTGLAYLKEKAKLSKDPMIYANMVLDNSEEPQWQALIYAIQNGAAFENLLQFDPEIADNPPIKEWFKAVYDELHAEIHGDPNSTGAGGNEDHPATDATAGTGGSERPTDKIPSTDTPKS
jgi:hypothetical protein